MKAEYRFLRTSGGVTRFAKATVESKPSERWEITHGDDLKGLYPIYEDAIRRGIESAVTEQERRAGEPHRVSLVALLEAASDTSADVVECSVAAATWKSFGYTEDDIRLELAAGLWHVVYKPA